MLLNSTLVAALGGLSACQGAPPPTPASAPVSAAGSGPAATASAGSAVSAGSTASAGAPPGFAPSAPGSAGDPEAPPGTLGRAGPVFLDLAGLREAIAEARILQRWQGHEAPIAALESAQLRQRLLTRALETRVMRLEVARRGLEPDAASLERALVNAALGRPADAAVPERLPAAEAIDGLIRDRFGAEPAQVARVARDLLGAARLAEALLDAVPEAELKQAWIDEGTTAVLDLVRVPRVPSSAEIDRAVRSRAAEIAAWYAANSGRFNKPERLRLARIRVPLGDDPAAARARAEGLRAQVLAGGDFEALARAESVDAAARQGGRLGLVNAALRPELAAMPDGALSPVAREDDFWTFYRVEGRAPASAQPLTAPTVQREIAATLLREADDLYEAVGLAQQTAALLGREPEGPTLAALVQKHRLKRQTTPPFRRSGPTSVPGLGLAPELFEAAFKAPLGRVQPRLVVRQEYVVFRVLERHTPDPAQWPAARADFVAAWRARERTMVVDRWLSTRLKGEPLWVAGARLAALPLETLVEGLPP